MTIESRRPQAPVARAYTPFDRWLMRSQSALRMLNPAPPPAAAHPGTAFGEAELAAPQRRHVAGLMRINHAGEIAAQALYHGQALVARNAMTRRHLLQAADEELAHLQWCEARLHELEARPSRLTPVWHLGSLAIGAVAGLAGDRVSLGFVEETERQVVAHLDEHLTQLPEDDARSRAILERMREDEARHGADAHRAGALRLPEPIRRGMRAVARVMKFGAYRW